MALVKAAKLLVGAVIALAVPVSGSAAGSTAAPADPGGRFYVADVTQHPSDGRIAACPIVPADGCCR